MKNFHYTTNKGYYKDEAGTLYKQRNFLGIKFWSKVKAPRDLTVSWLDDCIINYGGKISFNSTKSFKKGEVVQHASKVRVRMSIDNFYNSALQEIEK